MNPVKNANSSFVSFWGKGFTFPHEVVHIIGDLGHTSDSLPWNLMYKLAPSGNNPLAPKRLTQAQETRIRNSKFVK